MKVDSILFKIGTVVISVVCLFLALFSFNILGFSVTGAGEESLSVESDTLSESAVGEGVEAKSYYDFLPRDVMPILGFVAMPNENGYTTNGYTNPSFITRTHFQTYKDAGFNIISGLYEREPFNTYEIRKAVDLCEELGLVYFVQDLDVRGDMSQEAMTELIGSKWYLTKKAFGGISLKDEPSVKEFSSMSKATQALKELMPNVSGGRRELKFWLMLAAVALIAVMLARPQMGTKISQDKRQGIEVMIALDISNSMKAEDVAPSRLDKSKMMIENLVDNFTDDKVGLVVFAGDAFIQLPITSDYVSAKMFLQNIDPSLIASQGTNLAEAVGLSSRSFTKQDNVGRAIIVITDGEDHEGGAVEAAKQAKKNGMRVFVLGVGSTKGTPIPDGNGGYMKDNTGQVVMSALNEEMCKQVAEAGGGAYIHVDNNNLAQRQLDNEISKLQKGDIMNVVYSEYDEQFQAVGILLIIILIVETIVLESKNPLLRKVKLFK